MVEWTNENNQVFIFLKPVFPVSPGKRDSSSSGPHSPEHVAKRPHLMAPDHTPLTTSTGVTKVTSQRSPVIKLVNYTSTGKMNK